MADGMPHHTDVKYGCWLPKIYIYLYPD